MTMVLILSNRNDQCSYDTQRKSLRRSCISFHRDREIIPVSEQYKKSATPIGVALFLLVETTELESVTFRV